jgi:hypothetical protein
MAAFVVKATVGTVRANGEYPVTIVPAADQVANAATTVTAVAAAKVASAALETDAAAADALADLAVAAKVAGAAVTAVQDAMDVLQADEASPTEAHVDTADTAWDTVSAAITALHTAVDDVKVASAALETDAAAADALVDTAVTAAGAVAITGNVVLIVDKAVITSPNALKAALDELRKAVGAFGQV